MDLFSPRHLLIVLVIVLLVFGTKKLKTFGSDLGSAYRGFKDSMREAEKDTSSEHTPQDNKQIAGSEKPADKQAEKVSASPVTDKATHV